MWCGEKYAFQPFKWEVSGCNIIGGWRNCYMIKSVKHKFSYSALNNTWLLARIYLEEREKNI